MHLGSPGRGFDELAVVDGGAANQGGRISGSVNARLSRIGSGHRGRDDRTSRGPQPDSSPTSSNTNISVVGSTLGIGLLRNLL